MDTLLVKIFATALTLSQVTTAPDALKTQFDPVADQAQVVSLLRQGCGHMRKVFEIEDINLDDLLATAMEDPDLVAGGNAAFRGIQFTDLQNAYRQFCTNQPVPNGNMVPSGNPVPKGNAVPNGDFDARAVIAFYNKTVAELPDPARIQGLKPSGATIMLDGKGGRFTEVFDGDQRRISVPLADIPAYVQKAFVAAEDKRFFEHKGVDERGRSELAHRLQFFREETTTQFHFHHALLPLTRRGVAPPFRRGGSGSSCARIASRSRSASRMNALMSAPSATTWRPWFQM